MEERARRGKVLVIVTEGRWLRWRDHAELPDGMLSQF